jgi:ubiquinone/menaquinone biosynthesis C-methylase UbiE
MIRKLIAALRRSFRRKRYQAIRTLVGIDSARHTILDLGGGAASFFATVFPRPEQVILADISPKLAAQAKKKNPDLRVLVADAAHLPFAAQSIDTTVCNSVIEHVADPDALAREIQRVSQNYFLQTPNGKFPIETHAVIAIPLYTLVPWTSVRRLLAKLFQANYAYLSEVSYLSEEQLRSLFPEAAINYEHFFGLKKSFYVHHSNRQNP